LLEALSIQIRPSYTALDKQQTLRVNEIKNRLKEQYGEIYETIKYANLSLPQEIVEEIIIDVIMADSEKK
jgi:actin-like ATPase involved in cell morphogenesis